MAEEKKKSEREFIGEVVSTAMAKTIVVRVERRKTHPVYKKSYRVSKKYHVHSENPEVKVGDVISFIECRPLSKTKRWRLVKILKKNQ